LKKNKIQQDTEKKDTTTLRVMNWALSIALIFGTIIMIFNATLTGTLYLLFFLAIAITAYPLPAILLYPGQSKILGMTVGLDKKNKLFYKIAIGSSFLFLLIGAGIIITAISTGQYVLVILGFIFTLVSLSNVKALDICVKELK